MSRDMRRGRSRQVSQAALARQASEERRRRAEESIKEYFRATAPPQLHVCTVNATSISASPDFPSPSLSQTTSASMSPDSCDTPDTTPSLEDQVHIAYALDDIHLAKILLLRLKGIEVTSDDDPRIAAVQDEDFDICFVPSGRLTLDEEDEKAMLEAQRREQEKWENRRRVEKLRLCEKIWQDEKRRMRIEKLDMLKKKEEQALAMAEQRRRVERENQERRHQQHSRAAFRHSRGVVPYHGGVDHPPDKEGPQEQPGDDPFRYPFMVPCASPKMKKLDLPLSSLPYSNCVPFKDVLASMNGPLFPSPPHVSCFRGHEHDLLDGLLKAVQWEDGERRCANGKRKRVPASMRSSRGNSCAACSAASSSSGGSRWSFESSRSSYSTAATSLSTASPSCTPLPSWLNPTSPPSFSASPVCDVPPLVQLRHSCHSRLILVDSTECLLGSVPVNAERDAVVNRHDRHSRGLFGRLELDLSLPGLGIGIAETSDLERGMKLVHRVSRSVSSIVDLAKGIQSAYISATILSASPLNELSHSQKMNEKLGGGSSREKTTFMELKPSGYRVQPSSVSIFSRPRRTVAPDSGDLILTTPAPIYIPLLPPSSFSSACPIQSPRTHLPAPLPLQFPPPLTPPRSPLRPRQPPPPGSVFWRMRPVGNPVVLRLRALRNVLWERGVGWEGKGREGGLGAGRERLCRVVVEGRGRSRLGSAWEGAGVHVGVYG